MGNVIIISSQKRDIGKTIIGIKIGAELSNSSKILLIDLSSGKTKISDYFKVSENIIYDVKDVLDGTCSVEQAVIDIKENLSILPYPRVTNKLGNIKKDGFTKLLSQVKKNFDFIILDTDGLPFCHYLNFDLITHVIIADNNDFSSVNEVNNELLIAEKFNVKFSEVIINRFNKINANKGSMLRLKDLKKMLKTDFTGVIEEDKKYNDLNYDFIFNKDENTFNKNISKLINRLNI